MIVWQYHTTELLKISLEQNRLHEYKNSIRCKNPSGIPIYHKMID